MPNSHSRSPEQLAYAITDAQLGDPISALATTALTAVMLEASLRLTG
jgi:hypothetical protein